MRSYHQMAEADFRLAWSFMPRQRKMRGGLTAKQKYTHAHMVLVDGQSAATVAKEQGYCVATLRKLCRDIYSELFCVIE